MAILFFKTNTIQVDLKQTLESNLKEAFVSLYKIELPTVEFQPTRREFEGDITVVIFPMLRLVKGNPEQIGTALGAYLVERVPEVGAFNVIKGFLNLVISDAYYLDFFKQIESDVPYGFIKKISEEAVLVEYASPNTNKPLHLGHVRNVLLGYSVAEILKAAGKKVYKTQIINDRGIHICKSMLAWQKWGQGETPESSGLKGDKLVGNYYIAFDQAYKKQQEELVASGMSVEEAKKQAPILLEAQQMLQDWEAGKPEVLRLWKTMNGWVYDGFEVTYRAIGVDFDKNYYESDTYLLGKDMVEEGLEKGVFYKKSDGSVWIDLTDEGLDEKLVLRSDGTAVYMTQDIGTAVQRVNDFPGVNGMVYTVGNEQDYHFKVLFLILKKLGYSWAENLYHLSYGMVDLPSGKMKSREGTVVDADDLVAEMTDTAREIASELGKLDGYSEADKEGLYKTIGLGALKYFILKVDPKKRILFDPKESVDFQGNTGPFIQYTYARIQSIIRKAASLQIDLTAVYRGAILPKEKEIIKQLQLFPEVIQQAAQQYSPALIANYVYEVVREYNSFYQSVPIIAEADLGKRVFRIKLSQKTAEVIASAFHLLGIDVPERM